MKHILALPSGKSITYELERRPRRTVGLKITAQGLVVHAPKPISIDQLQQILLQKARWIEQKLAALEANKTSPLQWRHGEALLLFGNSITLSIRHDASARAVSHSPGVLEVAQPTHTPEAISRRVLQWYKKQAAADFARRLEIFAAKLGVATPKLFISNARTRWGSCNSRQEIRLNWRLLQAPPQLINYVICHELAHLKEMNHSARFWAVVASLYPEYKTAEKELKHWSPKLHVM